MIGAGGGYHAINNKSTFDVLAGGTFNREFFTTFNRSSAEVLVGETFTRKFSAPRPSTRHCFSTPTCPHREIIAPRSAWA